MKALKEALFSRKNIKSNPYGLTEEDLIERFEGFPMGVAVRMLEETISFRPELDKTQCLEILQISPISGFPWGNTEAGYRFWEDVIYLKDFNLFFKRYPEYERYNLL